MKNIFTTLLMTILAVSVFSCKQDSDKEEKETPTKTSVIENYNISLLLDLSDRISIDKNGYRRRDAKSDHPS